MSYFYKDTVEKLQKMKLFVYLRRSSEDNEDRQILSIPGQLTEIREQIIDRYGIKSLYTYEESRTAFKTGRPDFNEMVKRIENGEADGIIVWHPNRLARNYEDGGRFVQLMSDGKIQIVLSCQSLYENNGRDKEYLMNEFTKATRDSDDKSEAVKRGNRVKFFDQKGWAGPAKQGYLNYTDPVTKEKKIVKDAPRFKLIQKAMKLILGGSYTPMETLNLLNNEWGYRTRKTKRQGGKPMCKSSLYNLLADPYYYGLMVRSEGEITGKHNPMIGKEEFERLQIILGRKGRPHHTKHEFAYKEALKCGECGGSITCEEKWQIICPACKTKFNKGKKDNECKGCGCSIENMKSPKILHYIYYHCVKKINKNCSQGNIELTKLEEQADNELKRYEIPEVFKDWAIEHLNELNDTETEDREIVRANIKVAYDDCVKSLDSLLKLKISPQNVDGSAISEEEYISQRKYLLQEKEELFEKLNQTDQRINNWLELSEKTFNFACYARYWFAKGDLKTKTQILGALGSNLVIKDKNLLIDGQKHFFLIEKGKQEVEMLAKKFEPSIPLEMISKINQLEPLRSTWLGGMDSNHDT